MKEIRADEAQAVTLERDGAGVLVTLRQKVETITSEGEDTTTQHVYEAYQFYTEDEAGLETTLNDEFGAYFQRAAAREGKALAEDARTERDRRLAACDYRVAVDYPADDVERNAWFTYRQALRDVPEQENFPHEIVWPQEPEREKAADTIIGAIDAAFGGE